jgi:RNA recognition motif-containing protein
MEIDPNIVFVNNISSNQRLEPSRCVDLIVLGINYRSNEEDVRNYFQQFGELVFCEVRLFDGLKFDWNEFALDQT